jgi:hypothetical protein
MPETKSNPLYSKNIPPPPPARATPPAAPTGETKEQATTPTRAEEQSTRAQPSQHITRPAQASPDPENERATVELSLYLRPSQDDKLEDLRRAYKRRTGRKISANEVIRRLIEHATLEMLDISENQRGHM